MDHYFVTMTWILACTIGVLIMMGLLLAPLLYLVLPLIGAWTTAVRRAVPGGEEWREGHPQVPDRPEQPATMAAAH